MDALTQAGIRVHSEAAFALGAPRLLEFERALQDSRRTLLVLSPAYLADGFAQFTHMLAQSYGLESADWPVIPLVLQPVKLPPRLAMLTALDATDCEAWPAVVERLCAALQRPMPGPSPQPACPYPGMVPFSADDARFYYGGQAEIEQLRRLLRHQLEQPLARHRQRRRPGPPLGPERPRPGRRTPRPARSRRGYPGPGHQPGQPLAGHRQL